MTVASDFMAKLFARTQRSRICGTATDRLVLSKAQCHAYFEMRDIQEAEAFRGELQTAVNAVNAGAVVIEPLLPSDSGNNQVPQNRKL